jgi:GNAT superfamily N-acetyltransferase
VNRLTFRDATPADLGFIVRLIVEDNVVPTNDLPDQPDHPRYLAAFEAMQDDPNQKLVVSELAGDAVGTLQLTFIPGINRLGEFRCLIEAVHIAPSHRNLGLGSEMIGWAIDQARARGCGMVQLTSNKKRIKCPPLLRTAGLQQEPRRIQAGALTYSAARSTTAVVSGRCPASGTSCGPKPSAEFTLSMTPVVRKPSTSSYPPFSPATSSGADGSNVSSIAMASPTVSPMSCGTFASGRLFSNSSTWTIRRKHSHG